MNHIAARCHAQSVADNLTAAYWTASDIPERSKFLEDQARDSFKRLAAELGYSIELLNPKTGKPVYQLGGQTEEMPA